MRGPDQWRRVESIYHAALERPAAERPAFLSAACAGDEALRHEVESLLAHDGTAERFLAIPAVQLEALAVAQDRRGSLIGCQIGSYQIIGALGVGGMGEVYRAHDVVLGRDVAIKVLPALLSGDPERLARLEREAQLLAALNHPNIGAIYGVEPLPNGRALVLELVEGETLADRIARGPLGVSEALGVARQIADALKSAHDKGIIHRDLKPANVRITPEGVVKVLDFGLAKATGELERRPIPTASAPDNDATRAGVVMGTVSYMSPEQARGDPVDRRADIWAFGCVLFEMLTGKRAFEGRSAAERMRAVLDEEPDWGALGPAAPLRVHRLIRRCLEKSPHERMPDIGEARAAIDATRGPAAASWRGAFATAAAVALVAAAIAIVASRNHRASPNQPPEYEQITNFADAAMAPALSADGSMVVFKRGTNTGSQAGAVEDFLGRGEIFVKRLPDGEAVQLTSGPGLRYAPVFTPEIGRRSIRRDTRGKSVSRIGGFREFEWAWVRSGLRKR